MATKTKKKEMTTIIVDGSNVSYEGGTFNNPKLKALKEVIEEVERKGFRTLVFVDASLKHTIDNPKELEDLIKSGRIKQTPAATSADDFMLQLAIKMNEQGNDVLILTNDMFPVKREKGIIRRITLMLVMIGDRYEVLFNPPLSSLVQQSSLEISKEVGNDLTKTEIDRALFSSLMNFLEQLDPPVKAGTRIPFSSLANFLHNQFEGDFCKRFGYSKPKEFALALETNGFVKTVVRPPLYLDLTEKTIIEMDRFEKGVNESDKPMIDGTMDKGNGTEMIKEVLVLLEKEGHFPTDDKIGIKLRTLYPDITIEVEPLLKKAVNEKVVVKDTWKKRTVYWPVKGKWEAVDPDDPDDPYPKQVWADLKQAIHLLHSSQKTAQTRYHLARNLGNLKGRTISTLTQAQREHIVQLAVNKKILETTSTIKGLRITVPDTITL